MRRLVLLAIAAFAAALWSGQALAGDFFKTSNRESRFCDDRGILHRVKAGFRHQVLNVPHLPDVGIVAFNNIHEHRYLPHGDGQPIARRYCGATAQLSDGRHREVWYLIEDRMGFVGVGDGVEWCVSGFDRWMVYNGRCRVLR
jgi:hypothetical protein